ncbi:MAG: hypothetical protein WBB19_01335 [Desulforhopalus sp.]
MEKVKNPLQFDFLTCNFIDFHDILNYRLHITILAESLNQLPGDAKSQQQIVTRFIELREKVSITIPSGQKLSWQKAISEESC